MTALRIHTSLVDIDKEKRRREIHDGANAIDTERMVICHAPDEIQEAIDLRLQYAVRDNDILSTKLGKLHKLSLEQISHVAASYNNKQRERYGFVVPNVVIDLPWTWRMLTPSFKEKLGMFLYGISDHRLFLVLDHDCPKRIRRYPWDRLRVSTENFLFKISDHIQFTDLRDRLGAVGIGKMMLYTDWGSQNWNVHEEMHDHGGVDALMTGDGA